MKETELALRYIKYFEDAGYEIYKEVPRRWGRIDFVAVHGNIRTAVEVKTSLSMKLLEQAYGASYCCHYTYAAIPYQRFSYFACDVCRKMGIGLMGLMKYGDIHELVIPEFRRRVQALNLEDYMKESTSGTASGEYMTRFKKTIQDIVKYAKNHQGCTLKEAMGDVEHHYNSVISGMGSIRTWINKGIITEFRLDNGKIILNGDSR